MSTLDNYLFPLQNIGINPQNPDICACKDKCHCEISANIFGNMSPKIIKHLEVERQNLSENLVYKFDEMKKQLTITINFQTKGNIDSIPKDNSNGGGCCGNKKQTSTVPPSQSQPIFPNPQDFVPRPNNDFFTNQNFNFPVEQNPPIIEQPPQIHTIREIIKEDCERRCCDDEESSTPEPKRSKDDKSLWSCEKCGKKYIYETAYHSHVENCDRDNYMSSPPNNNNGKRKLTDDQDQNQISSSSKTTSQTSNLTSPPSNKSQKSWKCEFCNKSFSKKHHLKRHVEQVHSDSRPYTCQYCNISFKDKYNLKVHERIHTGEKPFQCHICNRSFNQKSALNAHVKIHEKTQQQLNRQNSATNQEILKLQAAQNQINQNNQLLTNVLKFYACDYAHCDIDFTSKNDLINHRLQSHPSEEKVNNSSSLGLSAFGLGGDTCCKFGEPCQSECCRCKNNSLKDDRGHGL